MAVTTEQEFSMNYLLAGDEFTDYFKNGGTDYRTVRNTTTEDALFSRCWAGDNISDACILTKMKITNITEWFKSETGSYATALTSAQMKIDLVFTQGSVSGTTLNPTGSMLRGSGSYFNMTRNSEGSKSSNYITIEAGLSANKYYAGVDIFFKTTDKLQCHIKNIKISLVRTRACYVTFKGAGITEKTVTQDYDTVPSFGSTPTRDGYTFKGWSNGTTTYSGTLPTAYEQDVTYTAVWEKNKVPCTITYNGNGATSGSVAAQSGYVGENLTLASNSFIKRACVGLYSNDIDGCEYNEDEDAIYPSLLSDANFLGWYTDAESGTRVGGGGASYTPTGNVTLYAHWSGYPAVTLPTLTREGYAFLGWYTDREIGTKVADGGESYTPVQPYKSLFAHWINNSIKLIYLGNKAASFYLGQKPVFKIFKGNTKIYYDPFAG